MNTKATLRRIQGWLPKEPALLTCQKPADIRHSLLVRWMAKAVVAGSIAGALLGVFGALAGLTEGAGAYMWPVAVAVIVGSAIWAVSVFARRKEEQQRRTETWVR